jgi:hypothetical protein
MYESKTLSSKSTGTYLPVGNGNRQVSFVRDRATVQGSFSSVQLSQMLLKRPHLLGQPNFLLGRDDSCLQHNLLLRALALSLSQELTKRRSILLQESVASLFASCFQVLIHPQGQVVLHQLGDELCGLVLRNYRLIDIALVGADKARANSATPCN